MYSHETRLANYFSLNQHKSKLYSQIPPKTGMTLFFNKRPIALNNYINFQSF